LFVLAGYLVGGITIAFGVLYFIFGMAFAVAYPGTAEGFGIILILLGGLSIGTGHGLRKGLSWTYRVGHVTGILFLLLGALLIAADVLLPGGGLVLFGGVEVYFLRKGRVREYLGHPPGNTEQRVGSSIT
jgi:hypothetical protein